MAPKTTNLTPEMTNLAPKTSNLAPKTRQDGVWSRPGGVQNRGKTDLGSQDGFKTDFGLIKESIDSMSDNVLEYKNLNKVKELMSEYILST